MSSRSHPRTSEAAARFWRSADDPIRYPPGVELPAGPSRLPRASRKSIEGTQLNRSPLLPLHVAAGARLTDHGDHGDDQELLTYGDVPGDYRAAMEACVVFDQTRRGQVSVSGADALTFLHRILANDVRGLADGRGCRNLILSSKGKVLHDFDLAPAPGNAGGVLLSTPPGNAPALASALDTYVFAEAVELADRTDQHAPLDVCGPGAPRVLEAVLGTAPPRDDHVTIEVELGSGPARVTHLPVAGSPGWRIDAGAEGAVALWRALIEAGAHPAGLVVFDILRVEAGRAVWGVDVDDSVYPQEARLEDAFSLEKGCYIGQEVVAKIDTYGGLNKRLMALAVGHDDPVARGTRLFRVEGGERRDLGVVTSWAYSFALDTGVVLAYVKRKHQEPGTVFELGDGEGEATIVALPLREGTDSPSEVR